MLEFIYRVMAWQESRDRGASAVEYALILGVIVALLVGMFVIVGNSASTYLGRACRALAGATAC